MTPGFQYDLSDIHRRYDAGRQPAPKSLADLAVELLRKAPPKVQRVLDLGCGTGRFSRLLADTFDCPVIAIEPADNMLGVAVAKQLGPSIKFARGSAMALPISGARFDLIFISQVLHHLPDLAAPMAEMRRVLRSAGRIFVRQRALSTSDGCPHASKSSPSRLPPVSWRQANLKLLSGSSFPSAQEYVEKIATRTNSDLAMVPDDEFAKGMKKFSRYVDAHPGHVWTEEVDHLVFGALA